MKVLALFKAFHVLKSSFVFSDTSDDIGIPNHAPRTTGTRLDSSRGMSPQSAVSQEENQPCLVD